MHKFPVHATLWLNISSIVLEDYQKVSEALSCLLVNICLNFGPFSNKTQYWLLWLRQMFVELWIGKEGLWVFIPCDIHRGWHIQQQQTFFFPAFCHSWIPTAGHQHSSYLFLDLGTSIPVFGQSPKTHNSPLEGEGYFCKKINLYWDLESMVKADHKKRKNPVLILKLAEVWSSFLRNYIIEYCLAVQRKTCNTVIGKVCTHLCAYCRNMAWQPKLQLILRCGFGAGLDHSIFHSSFFNSPSPRGCNQPRGYKQRLLARLCCLRKHFLQLTFFCFQLKWCKGIETECERSQSQIFCFIVILWFIERDKKLQFSLIVPTTHFCQHPFPQGPKYFFIIYKCDGMHIVIINLVATKLI